MGRISLKSLQADPRFNVVACVNRGDDLGATLDSHQVDVVLDFSLPDCVFLNAKTVIERGIHLVVGASGLTVEEISELSTLAKTHQTAGLVVPNFSISAVLMMQFAERAAALLSNVHIVELHHDKKVDAPSGTARKTAELIAQHALDRTKEGGVTVSCYQGVPIHSVRLPSLFAHQAVVFQGQGETLTIKHDASNRDCMMPGVLLACEKVMSLASFEYGLDVLL